jgi:hypothetical protein
MKKSKRRKLEAAGWVVGSVQEFLDQSKRTIPVRTARGRKFKVAKRDLEDGGN